MKYMVIYNCKGNRQTNKGVVNIKVELLNKEYIKDIFKNWGEFACVCYDTDMSHAEKVGKHCLNSGHFSGSRCEYFKFKISGISRACSLQLNRHSVGVILNQQSQRYVSMESAEFVVPLLIKNNNEALEIYNEAIEHSKEAYKKIQKILIDSGKTKEQANEDSRYILAEGCATQGVWGFTLESLIHLMHKRLCTRAQLEIRQLVNLMKKEVVSLIPELESQLVPHCEYLMWCPESKSCGRKSKKNDFIKMIKGNI